MGKVKNTPQPVESAPVQPIALPLVYSKSSKTSISINGQVYNQVVSCSVHNVMILLENDAEIRDCIIYNIFADDIFLIHAPPWENPDDFKPHPLRDDEILCFRAWVETRGLKCSKNDAFDILLSYARRNTVNPPHDYFEALKYDGKPRLDDMLATYFNADYQPKEYLSMVGSKWMIGVVSRIYEPGCKFDTALILEGDQYIGKSRALEVLATINGERYFTDENIDFHSKDSLIILQGKLIVEMAELASFKRSETDMIKGFMSRRADEYRPIYSKKTVLRPRMFAIAGSVNPNAGYLVDPTGNRRYLPVRCGDTIDHKSLERDREQLWAEAVHRYKKGERIYLMDEEYELAKIEQSERMVKDLIDDRVVAMAQAIVLASKGTGDFYLYEITDKLNIPIENLDVKMCSRITNILTAAGYEEYKPRIGDGKQRRKWRMKLKRVAKVKNFFGRPEEVM